MKKYLQLFLILTFVVASCASVYAQELPRAWYELDEQEEVLTITLPDNATTGYEWDFVISDPEALELATMEYVPDDNGKDLVGAGGTWVASFISTFEKAGNVDLTLNYKRKWEAQAVETRLVKVFISENNQLQVVSAETLSVAQPDWYRLSEDETVLTITLPANTAGYEWDFVVSDPEAFELLTMEYVQDENGEVLAGADGTWVASFIGTFQKVGDVDLTLNYKRSGESEPAETRLVKVFIVENNQLQVVSAEIL